MSSHELSKAVEFIKDKVYYVALRSTPRDTQDAHFFCIDKELIFWNFYLDFGPLNLAQTFRFSEMLNRRMEDPRLKNKRIYFYSGTHGNKKTNAVCLLTCWGIIYRNMSPEKSFKPFANEQGFVPFHDATPIACTFKLTILDCLRGLQKAIKNDYFNPQTFDVEEYEHFEKVENGDLSWLSRKFIAFAGPKDVAVAQGGYYNLTPEDYIPYYKKNNVTLVIRLNKKCYDEQKFISAGIDHLSLTYPDGSNPPMRILQEFISACEATPGVVAVHCKAGLGRTGTCIGSYMMKHEKFTAREVIGWLRLARPGSVIGPQQHFLEDMEQQMWKAGENNLQELTTRMDTGKAVNQMKNSTSQGDALVGAKRNQQIYAR